MKISNSKKLLLAEDGISEAENRVKILENFGYNVVHTQNEDSAIQLVRSDPSIDLILMDIDLGNGSGGIKTAEKILKIKDIPVVFLTSDSDHSTADMIRKTSRYGFVIKNSASIMLNSSIEMALELFEAHKAIELRNRIADETEKTFAKIFHTNSVLMSVSTVEDGIYLEVNETFLKTLGYNREEIIGKKSTDLNLWADPKDRASAIAILKKDGYLRHFETKVRAKNGSIHYGLFSVDYIEQRGERCMLSTMTDITKNRMAQEAVKRSEESFKKIFDQAIVGIANVSVNGDFLELNNRFCEIVGFTMDELLKMNYADITHPDDLRIDEQYILKVLNDEIDSFTIEKRYIHKDGHTVWVTLYSNVLRDEERKVKSAIAVIDDITSRKLIEKSLRESESHYHLLADHMSDAVWLMDLNLNITYCSPSVVKLRGFTEEEIMRIPIAKNITEESFSRAITVFNDEMKNAYADPGYSFIIPIELEYLKKDGTTFLGDSTFTLIRGKNGDPESILGETRDITERKNSENKINNLLKEKELLLKEVHHRIKNNMHTIASLLYLQADSLNDAPAVAALTDAYNRVQSMMLIYEKLYKSSDFREISAETYLTELIDGIASTINTSSDIEIIKSIEDCSIDTALLFPVGIIINELMTNSFKYAFPENRKGKIEVTLAKKENIIIINFSDDGVGIPGPIVNLESTGFGINLVKILAEQLDGELKIKSNKGTEFSITFPL